MTLLETYKKLYQRISKFKELVQSEELFDNELADFDEAFITSLGVPKDTTTKYPHEEFIKFQETNTYPDDYFCRDWHYEMFYKYLDDEITEETLRYEFTKLANEVPDSSLKSS